MSNSAHFQRSPDAPYLPPQPLLFVLYFVNKYRWWYLLILLLEIAASVSATFMPYIIGQVVQIIGQLLTKPQFLWPAIGWPVITFTLLNIAEMVFLRAAGACRMFAAPRLRRTVTQELYAYLQQHSYRFISNNFAGALAHRISETSQGVSMSLATLLFEFLPVIIKLGVSTALLFRASFPLGGFVGAWSLIFLAFSYRLARQCQPHAQRHAAARSETNGKIVDSVTNLSSVRLFARVPFEREYLNKFLDTEITLGRTAMQYMERIHWFQYSAAVVLKVGVLGLAAYLWQRGALNVAGFVMSISLALLIISEVRNLGRRFLELFEFIGNIANGVHSIVRSHEVVDAPDAQGLQVRHGAIEFRNVTFAYTQGQNIFEHLNLTIASGERVGLVGYSGSGKSTLVNLILRLYDPQAGAILIDGIDIKKVTQESLHSQISLIPQDPGLFHRTLLENIRYGNLEAQEESIREASILAHADQFIQGMPSKYDSLVGERGVKLSGGQRQRIAIARVIAKAAPILIMDEATSSLDSLTEKAIQESLETEMKGKTVIVVAHRLSTIAFLDRIVVFDQGRIVEDGSHAQLLAKNGTYARLWNRQLDGFISDGSSEVNKNDSGDYFELEAAFPPDSLSNE
jgi:ATP-binding cassette, subfamily B, bacterial